MVGVLAFTPRTIIVYPSWKEGKCSPADGKSLRLEAGDVLFLHERLVHGGGPLCSCRHMPGAQCHRDECRSFAVHAYFPEVKGAVPKELVTEFVDTFGNIV